MFNENPKEKTEKEALNLKKYLFGKMHGEKYLKEESDIEKETMVKNWT